MYYSYMNIGHDEERAELWAWSASDRHLWRATSLYSFCAKEGPRGKSHYDLLGCRYESNVPVKWFEEHGYAHGRVSHVDKVVSIGNVMGLRGPRLDRLLKLLAKTWPGYPLYRNGEEVFAGQESENLVEAA